MTAQRWWVRLFARWQARVDAVQGQIQAVSLAVTAFSTFSLLLQSSGHGDLVPYLGAVLAIIGPGYAYLFFEGGVWNQVSRDRADMSGNFAAPNARIACEMNGRTWTAGVLGRELEDGEREAIKSEADAVFSEYRDGYELDEEDDG
jgi:hypothetical protein